MLTISAAQMSALDDHALRKFVNELRPALAGKYPACLPSFPVPVQEQIIRNMIDRAKRHGIAWQSSILAFAEVMLAVAPNFYEHPAVHDSFRIEGLDPNRMMLSLDRRVSKRAWQEIAANTHSLPLYVSARWFDYPFLEQTISAIPLALGDLLADNKPYALATAAWSLATELGLNDVPDSGLVLTAWKLFYGSKFRDPAVFSLGQGCVRWQA